MTGSEKAKAFLTEAKFARYEIESLKRALAIERRSAERYRYQPANYRAFIDLLNQKIAEREAVIKQARALIGSIPDERSREVLELHYIDRLTLEDVAGRMFYSWRFINRIQAEALLSVAFLMGAEDD